jgi:EAL domain-containing protein (putative c-di-GMP-specific phosphodiesterase class I)
MMMDPSELRSELEGAVQRGEIIAHFQPQVDVRSRAIVAAEALARWEHPARGTIAPSVFIPLAEESGAIDRLGDHMIRLACEAARDWQRSGYDVEVAVNVSATQLRDHEFARRVLATVQSHEIQPRLLTIEVTESTEIIDVSAVAERLDWLRSVGMTISVDDFGTGHSSVEQVLDLRASELKIDQSLTQEEGVAARTLLGAVISFAHDKGLRVVAEGIETESQLRQIVELHCDRAQGYLLGRPMPKSAFDELLAHH